MLRELKKSPKVVGVKQLRKAVGRDEVRAIFLAGDADPAITAPIASLAADRSLPVIWVPTMKELGQACGIAVGASAAGLLAAK